jgi:hypothetical protein
MSTTLLLLLLIINLVVLIRTDHVKLCTIESDFAPVKENCAHFYRCSNGIFHEFSCAPGTLFDYKRKLCDYPENVACFASVKTGLRITQTPLLQQHLDANLRQKLTFLKNSLILANAHQYNKKIMKDKLNNYYKQYSYTPKRTTSTTTTTTRLSSTQLAKLFKKSNEHQTFVFTNTPDFEYETSALNKIQLDANTTEYSNKEPTTLVKLTTKPIDLALKSEAISRDKASIQMSQTPIANIEGPHLDSRVFTTKNSNPLNSSQATLTQFISENALTIKENKVETADFKTTSTMILSTEKDLPILTEKNFENSKTSHAENPPTKANSSQSMTKMTNLIDVKPSSLLELRNVSKVIIIKKSNVSTEAPLSLDYKNSTSLPILFEAKKGQTTNFITQTSTIKPVITSIKAKSTPPYANTKYKALKKLVSKNKATFPINPQTTTVKKNGIPQVKVSKYPNKSLNKKSSPKNIKTVTPKDTKYKATLSKSSLKAFKTTLATKKPLFKKTLKPVKALIKSSKASIIMNKKSKPITAAVKSTVPSKTSKKFLKVVLKKNPSPLNSVKKLLKDEKVSRTSPILSDYNDGTTKIEKIPSKVKYEMLVSQYAQSQKSLSESSKIANTTHPENNKTLFREKKMSNYSKSLDENITDVIFKGIQSMFNSSPSNAISTVSQRTNIFLLTFSLSLAIWAF